MKLLRFGFENETMPTEATVIVGNLADPQGTRDANTWKAASKGGEGIWFRQDTTDLSQFSGAYSFGAGREHPNTTCLVGFAPNETASNIDDATKNVFFNHTQGNVHQNQHLRVRFPASQGVGITYFYKLNQIIGMDTTGVELPTSEQGDYLFKRYADTETEGLDQKDNRHFSTISAYQVHSVNPGFMIPNRYHGDTPMGGSWSKNSQMGNMPVPSKTFMYNYPRGCAAGFYLSARAGAIAGNAADQAQADIMGGSAMVNILTMVLNGDKQDFDLSTNINLSGWNSIQVKYCTAPNHVFKVSLNGEDYEMYGNSNRPNASVVDTFLIPMTCNMHGQNYPTRSYNYKLPNVSMAIDDVAVNNNIINVDGSLQLSDSDIIIPPFIVCTGLTLTSEVGGGGFEYDQEASSAFDAIKTKNDIRIFSNKSAVHRFNTSKVPATLTGLEAINVYAKRCNVNFPSHLRYLGFGLESGNNLLMSDKAAHQLRPLSATERDGSISVIPDSDAKNTVEGLTTEKFNNDCTLYVESRRQIGLNFFGKADFNGGQDKRFNVLSFGKGGAIAYKSNEITAEQKQWPWGQTSRTDGNIILEASQSSHLYNNADTSNPDLKAWLYKAARIEPVSLRDGVSEIHCKNFIVKKDTHVAIGIGNSKNQANSHQYGQHINVPSVTAHTEYDANTTYNAYPYRVSYGKGMANISQSVVIIYAQENIYIDGDVYFEYGDPKFHAPNEHSYHSKNNRFSIVRFTGDGIIDFDMDKLKRLTNTSASESSFQQVPDTVYDYGDSSIPATTKTKAVDFSLEAGQRQGVVIHGSGGTYGDVYGKQNGTPVQLNGQSAIGWGCGGGGGMVTGWNGLLPGYRHAGQGMGNVLYSWEPWGGSLGFGYDQQSTAYGYYNNISMPADDNYIITYSKGMKNGYIHHDVAYIWRELFVSGNPNLGFRYESCARTGSEGGLWGGGRGASWTHKEPLAGISYEHVQNHAAAITKTVSDPEEQGGVNTLGGGGTEGNSYAFGGSKWKERLRGSRRCYHWGHPVTGYAQYKFHESNWADNTAQYVGTKPWLTRTDYCALPNGLSTVANGFGKTIVPNSVWNGDGTSPSLNQGVIYQFTKGANTASTAGRGGGGAPIVYLIAGGDIVIGTNGSVNSKGTDPMASYRNMYNIPAAFQNGPRTRGFTSANQSRASYGSAVDSFVQGLGHIDAHDKNFNQTAHYHGQFAQAYINSQSTYVPGKVNQAASLMGHGGGGGGCITFLHGGLFSNQGTINVDGADPMLNGKVSPGYWWNWSGMIGNSEREMTDDLLSFWGQARRDFDWYPLNSGYMRPHAGNAWAVPAWAQSRRNDAGVMQPNGILNSREQFQQVDNRSTPMYSDSSLITAPKGGAGAWRNFKIIGPADVKRIIS